MGIPSMGIYSHELFSQYGVDVILRVGSAGSYVSDVNLKDLFLVESSFTDSNYAENYIGSSEKLVYSSKEVNNIISETAKELNIELKNGTCHSSEAFYTEINLDELIKVMNAINLDTAKPEIQRMVEAINKQGKKPLSFDEYCDILFDKPSDDPKEEMQKIFEFVNEIVIGVLEHFEEIAAQLTK